MDINNLTYMRNDLSDGFNILQLQNKILEIAVDFDNFCRKNHINYYLMGGSALGAMRHGGFIPWDDDFDIFMEYSEYQRLINIATEKLESEKYHFQKEDTPQLPYFFSKIYMNGTTCISQEHPDKKAHHGIYIDIMCLNYVSNNPVIRKMQYYVAGMLKARAVYLAGYQTVNRKKKIQIAISNIFVRGAIKRGMISFVRKNNEKKSRYLAHYFGRAPYNNSVYPADFLGKARVVNFEQIHMPVPEKVEEYLTIRYGARYMDLPDEETKAMYQSHASLWDTSKDYIEYLK